MAVVSIVVINHSSSIENEREVRCLSAIKRQTYTDWEYYTQMDEEVYFGTYLNRVMEQSSGKYVMFINPMLIMAPNVIEALMKAAEQENSNCIPSVSNYININNKSSMEITDTLYGRLFSTDFIRQVIQKDPESFLTESEFIFWLRTLPEAENTKIVENTYIYGENIPLPEEGNLDDIMKDAECRWIPLLKRFSESKKNEVLYKMLSLMTDDNIIISALKGIAEYYPKENNVHMDITNSYLKSYYQRALSEDEAAFSCCKDYLHALASRTDLIQVLLPVLGMTYDQWELMERYDMKDFLFYRKWLPTIADLKEKKYEIQRLEDLLEAQISRLIEIESIGSFQKVKEEDNKVHIQMNPVTLEGPDLAAFTVTQYAEGKLGFRTILNSIKAWMKYKK